MPPATVAELLRMRANDDHPGLLFGDDSWSWSQVVHESARRAVLLQGLRTDGPFHVGVLLPNGPEYLFWLGGAALAGATLVGINPTRRGDELARDVSHADCQLLVTDVEGAGEALPVKRTLAVDSDAYADLLASSDPTALRDEAVDPSTLLLLLFTSGSTGAPKAVRCTQGRLAAIGQRASALYEFSRDDVCYCAMPLFHGNAVMAVWAPALVVGATFATRPRFSASAFLPDVRRFGATFFNYVGKSLAYVLATPERPDDADNPVRRGFGTEASERDIAEFERRFGCRVVEGYGMSEGGVVIRRVPDMPPGALGSPVNEATAIVDPDTLEECERARFDAAGRLVNADAAIGEIVNKEGAAGFEGYYANNEADAERTRNGWYWSGDLGYRDEAGFFYFAGRTDDWLRVDSENFGAAPVERILFRHPDVVMAAVYAVPDARGGDQVMAALELRPDAEFDGQGFAAFLQDQPDLGTKWAPRFVRLTTMPITGTNKVRKGPLRADGWRTADPVWWRPARDSAYEPLTDRDREALETELADHGRA